MARRRSNTRYRFVEAPPKRYMRRVDPESAPRLYQWLIEHNVVEEVSTFSSKASRAKRSKRKR